MDIRPVSDLAGCDGGWACTGGAGGIDYIGFRFQTAATRDGHRPTMNQAPGSPTSIDELTAPVASDGRGFVYVAACSGPEDILKVGSSHDPVERWSAFHRRWFEAFDLDRCLLVQTETRREARAMETALHRLLREHNCPQPLTMRERFGGATEWYRGAYATVLAFALDAQARGHVLHRPARGWVARAMRARAPALASLLDQALRALADGTLTPGEREAVRDLVDAHRAFDDGIGERFARELAALAER